VSQTVIENKSSNPGCLVRFLWFLFIGIPVGLPWMIIAWVFMITIIGLPVGLWMINRLPQIVTLRFKRTETVIHNRDGQTVAATRDIRQRPFLGRALYFILIGFWFSLVWLILAWVLALVTLGFGLPFAFWMFDQAAAVTTLARN
jgi:uncharacterized membrane protein YccF (DUF307 family)